ncbi:aminoglycoside phosphotransferase family protein [Streptomyces sp. CBMA156]|uniref:aminoglycoside phosphotransferase family protein n=1 Tax=Streptomyces sp. CBMA156 TaxID=1930280 RepID=UPI001662134C|nr:aminoglycoside phosphotransferase family protein [Streptomyces sp. CBMA156]MBD0672845.1 aminoglycoside phosphotransferase [Streptomyces sp. CBMA156]MBD0675804.1 aminoglycoside phosphotransferase [Streptomyces sp. CBMA156]
MTRNTPIPSDLRRWVTENLAGGDLAAADVSWPKAKSQVWRVSVGDRIAYVKISPSAPGYQREITGYRHAEHALDPDGAPRLLAADPGLQAILSSPQPGRVVRDLPLDPRDEQRVYELAGRSLRLWHDASAPVPDRDRERDAIGASMAQQAAEAAACLDSVGDQLDAAQRALVRCVADELPQLARQVPAVYRHGDFATRNWLWDDSTGVLGLIDFEMAAHGLAVEEYTWLYAAVWVKRSDLKKAFFDGYGRPLTAEEDRLLRLLTTRLGVSYLNGGFIKNNSVLIDRGRFVLARMADQDQ